MNDQQTASERSFSPYLPMFLLALALLTSLSFQTFSLVNEATQLKTAIASQDKAIEESQKIRTQLQELASQTLALANEGNANASTLIDEMHKKGVTIQGTPTPATAPAQE